MPTTKFQKVVYAFLTVFITVHLFVFYNLSIEMGGMSNKVFAEAWKIVPIEFCFAILLEIFVASPLSEKMTFSMVNPREDKPYVIMLTIISTTVVLMCPMMSFIATLLFNGLSVELLAQWMQKIVINFPFAFFTQVFFVQPIVRFIFGKLFRKQLSKQLEKETDYVADEIV